MDETVKILYEDAELIVCHKPAGLPVQSARVGQKDMVSILNNHPGISSVYVVHRLDQPVEGVLVFAKTKRAAAELSRQVSDGSMKKIYRAVCCVEGDERQTAKRLAERTGIKEQNQDFRLEAGQVCRLVDYLVRDGRTNTSSVVEIENQDGNIRKNGENTGNGKGKSGKRSEASGQKGGSERDAKRAELVFRIVERWECVPDGGEAAAGGRTITAEGEETSSDRGNAAKKYLLVEIELKTGRHHQIRVQMAHAGLPLYGDQKYNSHWREFLMDGDWEPEGRKPDRTQERTQDREQDRIQNKAQNKTQKGERTRLALCAAALTFVHPVTGQKMTFGTEPHNIIA